MKSIQKELHRFTERYPDHEYRLGNNGAARIALYIEKMRDVENKIEGTGSMFEGMLGVDTKIPNPKFEKLSLKEIRFLRLAKPSDT